MRKVSPRLALSVSVLVSLAAAASGASAAGFADERYWPQWRGPNFDGVAPLGNPPVEWSESRNVTWKTEIPGSGFASPIIWGDLIFILTAVPVPSGDAPPATPARRPAPVDDGAGDSPADPDSPTPVPQRRGGQRRAAEPLQAMDFTVMAVNRADGSLAWSDVARHETPHEGKQTNNSWASSSAITDGEQVFAFFGSRGLYAYDMAGNRQWEVDFGEMSIRNGFGEGSTPVLHGDKLVVVWDHQGDSFIAALDKNTGEELWRRPRNEPESWATPLVVERAGGAQVVTAAQNRTYSYDLASGEPIWEGPGLTVNPIPSPVESDGIVYLMSGYRGNALRAVRLADARGELVDSGAILWEYNQDTPYVPSPLLYDGVLYFLSSNSPILTAFNVATGEPHYGRQRLDGIQEIYSSIVGAAGRVYIVDRDGGAMVIESGPEFRVLATNSLDDGFEASPAIVGDELYLRGRRFLYRIEESG